MTETETAIPALYHHCKTIYDKMLEHGQKREADEGNYIIVYEGFLTHLVVGELGFSTPYYTFATKALKEMGCIRQLRRGGPKTQSQWEVIKSPTEELFRLANPIDANKSNLGRKGVTDAQQIQINDMNTRLSAVEAFIESMIGAEND